MDNLDVTLSARRTGIQVTPRRDHAYYNTYYITIELNALFIYNYYEILK